MPSMQPPALPSVWNFYKHLYDIWLDTTSEMLTRAMRTPAFAWLMGRSLTQSLEIKRQVDGVLEAWLKSARVATDADIQVVLLALKRLEDAIARMAAPRGEAPGEEAGGGLARLIDDHRKRLEYVLDDRLARRESPLERQLSEAIAKVEANGVLLREVAERLRLILAETAAAKKADQPANHTIDQPASFANLAKALVQSSDFRLQIEDALAEGLARMEYAAKADTQAVRLAVEAADAKIAQIASSIGAFAANLGKAIEQLRHADDITAAALANHLAAIESETKAVRSEVKAREGQFETIQSLVRSVVGSLDEIAKQLALLTAKGASKP